MSKRAELLYLQDISAAIGQIEKYQKGMSLSAFTKDIKTVDAIVRNLEIVGEAANNLSTDFKKKNNTLPWREMVAVRNKVLHEYFGIDLEILWETTHKDLPKLKKTIEKLIKDFNK